MPSNIYQPLPTTSPSPAPVVTGNSVDGAQIGSTIGNVINTVVSTRKANVLGELALEAQSTVSQTAAYQQAKDSIVAGMKGSDKNTFEQMSRQLERLRNGEVQGVISPSSANLRLQTLAKTYINRYPRMAQEIRQMLKLVSGDIAPETATDDINDPVLKAQYEIVEEAAARGTSPQDVIMLRRQKDATEMSKAKLEEAEVQGKFKMPELMFELVDNKSSEVFSELISGMVGRIRNGSFVKENELTGLRQAMTQSIVDLNRELTNEELRTGIRVDHAPFEQRIRSAFEPLISMANEADSLEKQRRFASAQDTILKATDYKYLHDTMGAFAQIAVNSPEQMFKLMEEMSTTIEDIKKGQLPSLEQAAQYDPKTRMILDALKNNGKSWDILMKRTDEILSGKAAESSTGSEAVDRLAGKIILDTAAKPGTPLQEAGDLLAKYINSGDPIDAVLYHKRTHAVLRQSPAAQEALDKQVLDSLTSYVMTAPISDIRNLQADFNDPSEPFKNVYPTRVPVGRISSVASMRGLEQPSNAFVNKMNDFSKLLMIYKDPPEAQAEVQGKFEELVQARVKADLEAAQEIMGRPGPHQGDKQAGEQGGVNQEEPTITEVGTANARYSYDENTGAIVDNKRNRILPDTYTFTPEELQQLQRDLGPILEPGYSNNPDDHIPAQ